MTARGVGSYSSLLCFGLRVFDGGEEYSAFGALRNRDREPISSVYRDQFNERLLKSGEEQIVLS